MSLSNAGLAELLAVASKTAPYPILQKALRRASALLAGVARDRVLNFLSLEELLDWVSAIRQS